MLDNACSADADLAISVVFPLVDPRGNPLERVRSWTHAQTLRRDRYQVVAVSDGSDPRMEQRMAQLLAPQDRLVRHASDNLLELYDAGCRSAGGRLLVLSEHHCVADPNCLAEVLTYFEQHDCHGACLNVQSICWSDVGRLFWRMYEADLQRILETDHWNKFMVRGVAIDREVLRAAGGVESRYGFFWETAIGAKLDSLGYRMGFAERAFVSHVDNNTFSNLLAFTRNFTEGEIVYRADHDAKHCERYFGHVPDWAQRFCLYPENVRYACAATWRALWDEIRSPENRRPAMVRLLACELSRRLPARVLPAGLPLAAARLAVTAAWLRFAFWRFKEVRRAGAFSDARNRMVHYVRMKCVRKWLAGAHRERQRDEAHLPLADTFNFDPGGMDDSQLIGFHAREQWNGHSFRWTEPVSILRLDIPAKDYAAAIETRSLRGATCDFSFSLFWNWHPLPRSAIRVLDGQIFFAVNREMCDAKGPQCLVTICEPLVPRRSGVIDDRRLGLPVFSVRLTPANKKWAGTDLHPASIAANVA